MSEPSQIPSTHQLLEWAIISNPNDRAAHAAYADILIEQADPIGEFIRLQLASEDESLTPRRRETLTAPERDWLAVHERDLIGRLVDLFPPSPTAGPFVTYRHGLWYGLEIGSLGSDLGRAILEAPGIRFLRRLTVLSERMMSELITIAETGPPPPFADALRSFQYGQTPEDNYQLVEAPWGDQIPEYNFPEEPLPDVGIARWVARFPNLERLHVHAAVEPYALFRLELPCLRVLRLDHGPSGSVPLGELAANLTLANLTTLVVHPHMEGNFPLQPVRYDGLTDFLNAPHLSNLTHLHLRCGDIDDRDVMALEEAGWLRRLRTLDLRHGRVGNRGALYLAESSDFAHLERLDLRGNRLTRTGVRALRRAAEEAGVRVLLAHQRRRDFEGYDDDRYDGIRE